MWANAGLAIHNKPTEFGVKGNSCHSSIICTVIQAKWYKNLSIADLYRIGCACPANVRLTRSLHFCYDKVSACNGIENRKIGEMSPMRNVGKGWLAGCVNRVGWFYV